MSERGRVVSFDEVLSSASRWLGVRQWRTGRRVFIWDISLRFGKDGREDGWDPGRDSRRWERQLKDSRCVMLRAAKEDDSQENVDEEAFSPRPLRRSKDVHQPEK
jgi:hypothetical protein